MQDGDEELVMGYFIRPDFVDLRDQYYSPSLAILPHRMSVPKILQGAGHDAASLIFGIRNQGRTGRCAGYALAALIDIQRHIQHQDRTDGEIGIASADMLYHMANFHENYAEMDLTVTRIQEIAQTHLVNPNEGLRTLRSVIKGFYHHGVCLDLPPEACPPNPEAHWQSTCYMDVVPVRDQRFPNVAQARAARNIGLGAYYRLRPVLNHYHAALHDAGAILVSANVHGGWMDPYDDSKGGRIAWQPGMMLTGAHAFVIVGYTDQGFLVLNSWGDGWGGFDGTAGLALWDYTDWAQNVLDGWVLRLGVPAPAAFDTSVGEQGTSRIFGPTRAGSTPCYEYLGHYMHLDDGFHVEKGAYPSFDRKWQKTFDHLYADMTRQQPGLPAPGLLSVCDEPYKGILLWLPGSLEGIKPAFDAAVKRKKEIQALGLYPYTIFWCNSFVDKSLEVLTSVFEDCTRQAGEDARHLDALIENTIRGIGRAFWRDIEQNARRAVNGARELPDEPEYYPDPRPNPGCIVDFVNGLPGGMRDGQPDQVGGLLDMIEKTGCELHIVAEGAGVLVLHELIRRSNWDRAMAARPFREYIDTLHLVQPAIGVPRAKSCVLPLVRELNNRGAPYQPMHVPDRDERASRDRAGMAAPPPPARIYLPTPELEKRVQFGAYGKSVLHLVARAFEDRYAEPGSGDPRYQTHPSNPPRMFLGMAEAACSLEGKLCDAISTLDHISDPRHAMGRVPQHALSNEPDITAEIFATIRARRAHRAEKKRSA